MWTNASHRCEELHKVTAVGLPWRRDCGFRPCYRLSIVFLRFPLRHSTLLQHTTTTDTQQHYTLLEYHREYQSLLRHITGDFFQLGHPKFGLEILFLIVHSGFEEVGLLRKWTHTLTHTHRQRVPHCLDALLLREVAGLTPRSFPQRSCRPLPLIHPSPWSSLWGRKNLTTFKRIITRF